MHLQRLIYVFPGAMNVPAGVTRPTVGQGGRPAFLTPGVNPKFCPLLRVLTVVTYPGGVSEPLLPEPFQSIQPMLAQCPALLGSFPVAAGTWKQQTCSCYCPAHMPSMAPYCSENKDQLLQLNLPAHLSSLLSHWLARPSVCRGGVSQVQAEKDGKQRDYWPGSALIPNGRGLAVS